MTGRRLHVARADVALHAIDFLLGWGGGVMPVELAADRQRFWHRCGVPGSGQRLARSVRWHDERADTEIRLGVPHRSASAGGVTGATVLWAVVEGSDQVGRAMRFRPLPSMVLRAGGASRRWLLWSLEEPLDYFGLVDANRKLAYHFGARQKLGDPDLAWFPAPGSCLREGRARPSPVVVSRLSHEGFTVRQLVGRLKEPPPRDAWITGAVRR